MGGAGRGEGLLEALGMGWGFWWLRFRAQVVYLAFDAFVISFFV
jgi:hypothetical protein